MITPSPVRYDRPAWFSSEQQAPVGGPRAQHTQTRERTGFELTGVLALMMGALAWAVGEFQPSAFTSELWRLTAVVTSAWFMLATLILAWWPRPSGRPQSP